MSSSASQRILELKNISKIFPGVKALDDVSMEFKQGEVHALMGENGAGKSTLIKILTGAHAPNTGSIILDGKTYTHFTPIQAISLGISAIYQEFNLIPYLDISENIFYGRELKKGLFLDKKKMVELTKNHCESMGVRFDPKTLVKDLGVAHQQIIEIIKSISRDARIIIMDEPSAPLTNREIEALFAIIRKLKEKGITIIYISHRLEEIFEICDRITIMRDGKYITTKIVSETTRPELISAMVGRDLVEVYPEKNNSGHEVILEVKGLNSSKLKNINFQLKKGEILGIGGLVGAGRTELARSIFGADPIDTGEIILNQQKIKINSPEDAIQNGIGLLPEDRKQHGLILGLSIKENITYGILKSISQKGVIKKHKEESMCSSLINDLTIKTPSMLQIARNLSGGNQQKVVIAKWLASKCDILIFDEPTRGIDVGAKQEIYFLLKRLAEEGKSIIMISSEMPELLGMSDRILVMNEGTITGEINAEDYSQEKILELASGS